VSKAKDLREGIEGDTAEGIWRRGLVYRMQTAVIDAEIGEWSKFTVDAEHVDMASTCRPGVRAAAAVVANPGKSNRAIAAGAWRR
jgi:hypothetical protein